MPSGSSTNKFARLIDWALLGLLVYELPSCLFSRYCANSISKVDGVGLSVVVYLAIRFFAHNLRSAALLAGLIGVCGAGLSVVGIRQFLSGTKHFSAVGLTDILAFRAHLVHPISDWVGGENYTLLLLALPFASAAVAYIVFWLRRTTSRNGILVFCALLSVVVPIVAVLFLSLSRAAFWSTIFFFIAALGLMTIYKVITPRIATLTLAGCWGLLLLVLACEIPLYPGIFRAYTGHHVSQTRSTEGRLDTWHRSLEVVREHPVWGVGSSNAALFLLSSTEEDDITGFTSRTFSLPIQIFVEKGLIGFTLYSAFLLALAWEFHRNMHLSALATAALGPSTNTKHKLSARNKADARSQLDAENTHRAMKCIFAAGLAAVLVRELTYSSLLEHTAILALTFTLAALMIAPTRPSDLEIKQIKPLAVAVAVIVLLFQWPYWRYHEADEKLKQFYGQVASANFIAAKDSIDEAIQLWSWNARYYGWRGYLGSQQLPSQCPGDEKTGGHPLSDSDQHTARVAAEDYRHSLALNGRDAVAHHNLAWLEHLLGDNAAAARDWKESVELDPGNAAFHLSYGMFLDEAGSVDAAKAQYESAIELTPSIVDSQFFTRYRARSPEAADLLVKDTVQKLEARLGTGNDPILEARLGKLYLFEGDTMRARRALEDAAKQLPNLPLVWFNLGQLNEGGGDSGQARDDFAKARVIDASSAGPYLQLGQLSLREGDKQQANQYLSQAIQRWQRVNPVTSAHNNRLYDGPRQPIDDLLPTTLVWYISPCEASAAWRGLSEIYPRKVAYSQRSRTCEEIPSPH